MASDTRPLSVEKLLPCPNPSAYPSCKEVPCAVCSLRPAVEIALNTRTIEIASLKAAIDAQAAKLRALMADLDEEVRDYYAKEALLTRAVEAMRKVPHLMHTGMICMKNHPAHYEPTCLSEGGACALTKLIEKIERG